MTQPAPAPDSAAAQRQTLVLGVLLLCALAFAYLPALRGAFIWDDDAHVTANPTIVGPQGLKEIWTTPAANYFPLVLTNFRLQHALWGLDPLPYHAVTLAFHMGNALLLWAVLRRLRVSGAWLGAALWALHPVQAESVSWISELKNTQSGFFFLLSIFFWVQWLDVGRGLPAFGGAEGDQGLSRPSDPAGIKPAPQRRASTSYVLAIACGLLAILSKPSAVMLPVALAIIAWWQCGKLSQRDLVRLAPLFVFAALAGGWAIWEQRIHQGAAGAEWNQTGPARLVIAGRAVWFYLGKLFFPHPLAFIYHRWVLAADRPLEFAPLVAVLIALAVVGFQARRHPALAAASLYFVAMLFPVLGFFNVYFFRYSFVSDHFQYLASMAPLALIGAGLADFAAVLAPPLRRLAFAGVAVLLVTLSVLTWAGTHKFSDDETLWRDTIARDPQSWIAHNNLGNILANREDYAGALASYQRAVASNPDYIEALNNLGTEFTAANRVPEALACLSHALQLAPNDPEVRNNLANAYRCADRPADAIVHLEAALSLRPNFYEAQANLARTLITAGRPAEAIPHFERALALQPEVPELHAELAAALRAVGRTSEAIDHADAALRLRAPAPSPARRAPPSPTR